MLQAVAYDTLDSFDKEKAGRLMNEKNRLQHQLDQIADAEQKRENAKFRLDEIFTILYGLKNHPMTYKVVFVGGTEITQMFC